MSLTTESRCWLACEVFNSKELVANRNGIMLLLMMVLTSRIARRVNVFSPLPLDQTIIAGDWTQGRTHSRVPFNYRC